MPKQENTLYQTKDKQYGHYLATNAEGKIVLSMSDGTYKDFAVEDLEKVVPYTIKIEGVDGRRKDVQVTKGKFEVGDLLVHGCKLSVVVELDTKREGAQKFSKAKKVATVEV